MHIRTLGVATLVATLIPAVSEAAQREITFDEPAGVIQDVFSSINGLTELSDGRFLVSDGLGQALIRVDLQSGTMDTLGSTGRGPDEYQSPDVLLSLPGDSVILTDLGNGRLTVIHPDGEFGRTEPIARERGGSFTMMIPRAADTQGRIYFAEVPQGPGGRPASGNIARWDPSSESLDIVGQFKLPDMNVSSSGGPNNQQQTSMPVPLSPQDAWAALPDGRIAVARAEGYRVDWIRPDGSERTGNVVNAAPRRVTDEDKEAWIDRLQNSLGVEVEAGPSGRRMSFSRGGRPRPDASRFEWPETMPLFEGVIADPEGYAWVQRYEEPGSPSSYDVFDDNGRMVARVNFEPGRTLLAVTGRRLYVQVEDEMGLVTLELHRRPSFGN